YENGLLSFSVPDPLGAEEATQFALLEHPNPRRILLIGGGVGGRLEKILMYPSVQAVDYVELNPAVISLGKQFIPSGKPALLNPMVHIYTTDARLFLERTRTLYDVIILDMPPPYTAQLNRLYTVSFFRNVSGHLSKGGVFSFGLPGSENFIGADLARYLATFQRTLRAVFKNVLALPGNTIHFVASNGQNTLTSDPAVLIQRLQERKVKTLFISPFYLPFRLSEERRDALSKRLKDISAASFSVNKDFYPIAYYYDILLWSTYFYQGTRNVFRQLAALPHWIYFVIAAAIYIVLLLIRIVRKKRMFPMRIGISIFTIGFTEIAFEVLLILGFQIVYGYAYYLLSIIITVFMAGLALGSGLAQRIIKLTPNLYRSFIRIQLAMAALPIFYGLFLTVTHQAQHTPFADSLIYIAFAIFTLSAGFLGGFQFPVGNQLYMAEKDSVRTKNWGTLYGLDLAGSFLGALLIAVLFTPLLGMMNTLLFLAFINLFAWMTLKR
ncbi:MAG TPA: hypothetical protein ENH53_08425, partial [Bacteroidetes bacterium]|nr:hypothetical protein [Bacteroidota bacterium]